MEIIISWTYDGYDRKQRKCHKFRQSETYHMIGSASVALDHFLSHPSRYSDIEVSGCENVAQLTQHYRRDVVKLVK